MVSCRPGAGVGRGERGDGAVDRLPAVPAQRAARPQDAVVAVACRGGCRTPRATAVASSGSSCASVVTLRRTSAIRGSWVPRHQRPHRPGDVDGDHEVGAPVLGVRRGEDVIDVVRAEHVEGRGGDGRQLAVGRALRSGAVRSAQPGLGERPVGRGAAERGPEGVERLRPARVGGRRGGREPAVAQLRRVVGRGDDRAPFGRHRAQLPLGDEPDLARAGRDRRGVGRDDARAGERDGQRVRRGVHAVGQPHRLADGAEREQAVAAAAGLVGDEPDLRSGRRDEPDERAPATAALVICAAVSASVTR